MNAVITVECSVLFNDGTYVDKSIDLIMPKFSNWNDAKTVQMIKDYYSPNECRVIIDSYTFKGVK